MRVFVTGIAGFLGRHIADAMLKLGHEVYGNDSMIGGDFDNVPAGACWAMYDCNDLERLKGHTKGIDLIYHCAATAYEGLSVFSPHLVIQNIVGASTAVFTAAAHNKVKRVVHCSSMARYGNIPTPYHEDMIPVPQDPYGIAKLAAEQILHNLAEIHGFEHVIAVPHNIIGPYQKYDDPFRNVASIMINRMLQGKQPIIYGTGNQQRCFSFIDDCLSCLVKMGIDKRLNGQIINIGPDETPVTINDLAVSVAHMLNFKLDPIYMPGRPQEVPIALCSSDKARRLLDYYTKTTLMAGLFKMACHICENGGAKAFKYHLPIEIQSDKTPKTWTERIF